MVIYDGQSLASGNIGRHYLDAAYLYDNKAIACQHKLLGHKAQDTCPPVLFTRIDGGGHCTRTVHYDGTGGCYRCLLNVDRTERFEPLLNPDDAVPTTYQCGESYTPYPPSVSVQAAGLALDAVLDWVQGRTKPQFRNRILHQKARNHKDQQLTPAKGCPACQS